MRKMMAFQSAAELEEHIVKLFFFIDTDASGTGKRAPGLLFLWKF